MNKEEIKQLRESLSMTQEKFARHVGVTLGAINRWEMGKVKPSELAINRLLQIKEQTNARI